MPRPTARLRTLKSAMKGLKKQDLVDSLADVASLDPAGREFLERRLGIQPPPADVAVDVARDIEVATEVDPRDARANMNIEYDGEAYERVAAGPQALISAGDLDAAKRLCLERIKRGCYQCECSDESLMIDELEDCLSPVIAAVGREGGATSVAWARAMIAADRVKFICDKQLSALISRG